MRLARSVSGGRELRMPRRFSTAICCRKGSRCSSCSMSRPIPARASRATGSWPRCCALLPRICSRADARQTSSCRRSRGAARDSSSSGSPARDRARWRSRQPLGECVPRFAGADANDLSPADSPLRSASRGTRFSSGTALRRRRHPTIQPRIGGRAARVAWDLCRFARSQSATDERVSLDDRQIQTAR